MQPTSIAHSTGMQATGTSQSMHVILTVTTSISDVPTSMPLIAADTLGIVMADMVTTMDTATTSIATTIAT